MLGKKARPGSRAGVFPRLRPSLADGQRARRRERRSGGWQCLRAVFLHGAGAGRAPRPRARYCPTWIAIARYDRACNTGYDDPGLKGRHRAPRGMERHLLRPGHG